MKRRSFLALASGLLVPDYEPVRAYSFIGGWREHVMRRFVLRGPEMTSLEAADVIEWLRRRGEAGVLTKLENVRLRHVSNDQGDRLLLADIPAVERPREVRA